MALPSVKKSSAEELSRLRAAFRVLDKQHRGDLGKEELTVLCKEVGMSPELAPLITMVFDGDNNARINFQEFVECMESIADLETHPRRFFKHVFNAIDRSHTGRFDPDELVKFAGLLNVPLSRADALEAIDETDLDGDHEIDFSELCVALGI